MARKLHHFHGGLKLIGHKSQSTRTAPQDAGLPGQIILPLKQHIGAYNQPLVSAGQRVLAGEMIANNVHEHSVAVHASTSGTVRGIEMRPVAHPSGQSDHCIVIDVDGGDEWVDPPTGPSSGDDTETMIDLIGSAGIAGLGGAVFSTASKLAAARRKAVHTLIINGVECEPYISCDDALMRYHADSIVRGIELLQRLLQPRSTLIAIEDNKPEACDAMAIAMQQGNLASAELVVIPTIYPSGGEKQLLQVLTGLEVPENEYLVDIGYLCQNVGTCAAIADAIDRRRPLVSRMVSVSGDNVVSPANWQTRLGTPVKHLIDKSGGLIEADRPHLIMGGPMMGFALSSEQVPVVKASNNFMVMRDQSIPHHPGEHDECVRCGQCAEVCPARLLPQQLYWHSRSQAWEKTVDYKLFDCIECGCCSAVCPSNIPLVQYYRTAKSEVIAARKATAKSDRARERFEFREKRLLLKKQQDEERRRKKREALKNKQAPNKAAEDPVKAALARVQAKKQARTEEPKNTDNLSAAQRKQIQEARARRKQQREAEQ